MEIQSEDELRRYVTNFLREFKELVLEGRLFITNRVVNRNALIELCLTENQRTEELLSLSVSDYSSGPKRDEFTPGSYWVFGKELDGIEVYIKLMIASGRYDEKAVCMSFHRAERPLHYPFR